MLEQIDQFVIIYKTNKKIIKLDCNTIITCHNIVHILTKQNEKLS